MFQAFDELDEDGLVQASVELMGDGPDIRSTSQLFGLLEGSPVLVVGGVTILGRSSGANLH